MNISEETQALEVRAPIGASRMEIVWADNHCGIYPHEILRGFCPCAHCQGHQGPIRFVQPPACDLQDLAEVGRYALRLTWSDGHATGIYTFRFLRRLCTCAQCCPGDARTREFDRG